MLIQFSVRNFRTFKEKATLSLVASNYDKGTRESENIIRDSKYDLRILKSAVIYGANASGKSKFIEALKFMSYFAINSSRDSQMGNQISVDSFKLSGETVNEPSEFEVLFSYKNVIYRYGFEVNKKQVVSEWLFQKPKTKEVELFYRNHQEFETHPRNFQKGSTLAREQFIRNNALMLSVAAQFNDTSCVSVVEWFKSLDVISGLREPEFEENSKNKIKNKKDNSKLLDYLKKADFGIIGLKSVEVNSGVFNDIPIDIVMTQRNVYEKGKKNGLASLSMNLDESEGTKKYFYLLGPVLDAIENGYTLVVDELDSKLHPNLVCKMVALFNSKEHNPKNAQLIFNTHDTNLLSSGLFRRDQVWFTEKDKYGEATLYSLADFKSDEVRKFEAYEENYLRGKYGAVPFLGLFDDLTHKK